MATTPPAFLKAQRHLGRRDAVMRRLIKAVGPCRLEPRPDRFYALVRSIISQQISTKAASSITGRLEVTLGKRGICPESILHTSEEALRSAGLSAGKIRALLDLATKVHEGEVPLDTIHELTDEEVIETLIPVRGIGRWTAEMFLIFSLGRLDVLPVDDLGLRVGVQRHYQLPERPGKVEITAIAEPWRPFRSVATWYLWRSLANNTP